MNKMLGAVRNKTSDPTPIYYKLQQELKQLIESGQWAPGDHIPPSRKIAETYGVSMGTVLKAISNLVNEKYLYSIQGKGTFVATTNIKQESLRYIRLRRDFRGDDLGFKIKLINFKVMSGFQPVSRFLKSRVTENLYTLKRVFITSIGPIVYNTSYLPCKMFKDFEDLARSRFERETLYQSIEQAYGLPTLYNHELIGVTLADKEIAEVLGLELGQPVLTIEMLSFTYKDQPYEYRISYCLTDNRKLYREIT
ncbi:MAG: GntR family transcriptional regulator [Deltaproteobacteria bacterium]|nr:GntR family transcriptional regulator [Deltaproteobacteria bacterium]MBW2085613.1 GntR family transcriptional regulator [Deltaproteobacteria bacterium]